MLNLFFNRFSNKTIISPKFQQYPSGFKYSNISSVSCYLNENYSWKRKKLKVLWEIAVLPPWHVICIQRMHSFPGVFSDFFLSRGTLPILRLLPSQEVIVSDNILVYRSPQTTISDLMLPPSVSQSNIDPYTAINNQLN